MKNSYSPIDPDYFEIIEIEIEKNKISRVYFFETGDVLGEENAKIESIVTIDNFENFIKMSNGKQIRMDRIVTVNGIPGPAYDEYDRYALACLDCNANEDN